MSSEAKNLAALDAALRHHAAACPNPPLVLKMNPFEVERLGWDEFKGVPIVGDPKLETGVCVVVCRDEDSVEERITEAISEDRELQAA